MDSARLQSSDSNESLKVLVGQDDFVSAWVQNQLKMSGDGFGPAAAMGVVKDNKIIGGCVYFCFRKPSIEMACASTSPHWLSKKILRLIFHYPFNHLGCTRITTTVSLQNKHAQKFNKRLGFVEEGVLREALPEGDATIYGMLKNECRWL